MILPITIDIGKDRGISQIHHAISLYSRIVDHRVEMGECTRPSKALSSKRLIRPPYIT